MLDLEVKKTKVYEEILEEGREEGREEGQLAMAILIARDLLKTPMSIEDVATVTRLELSKVIALQQEEGNINANGVEASGTDEKEA